MYNEISDGELIYLCRCGVDNANKFLYERYKPRIFGFINEYKNKILKNNLDFDDLFQEAIIIFYKCLNLFDEKYNFYLYLKTAVLKRLYAVNNKNYDYLSYEDDLKDKEYMLDSVCDCSQEYNANELIDGIKDKLDLLGLKVLEYKLKGYNCLEIASMLDVSKKMVYSRLEKIKDILKQVSEFNN